jgi:hypothetical protein
MYAGEACWVEGKCNMTPEAAALLGCSPSPPPPPHLYSSLWFNPKKPLSRYQTKTDCIAGRTGNILCSDIYNSGLQLLNRATYTVCTWGVHSLSLLRLGETVHAESKRRGNNRDGLYSLSLLRLDDNLKAVRRRNREQEAPVPSVHCTHCLYTALTVRRLHSLSVHCAHCLYTALAVGRLRSVCTVCTLYSLSVYCTHCLYSALTAWTLHSLSVHCIHCLYTALTVRTLHSLSVLCTLSIHCTHCLYTALIVCTLHSLSLPCTHFCQLHSL